MTGASNTVSVIHFTEQDGSSVDVHVYIVPDSIPDSYDGGFDDLTDVTTRP